MSESERASFHSPGPFRLSEERQQLGLTIRGETTGEMYWVKISCGDASITLVDDDIDWLAAMLVDLAAHKARAMKVTKLAKEAMDVKET